jgi:hypothetical protein
MTTARPFAYNPGATAAIPGTEQIGNLSIGTPLVGFVPTGLEWWNGPDEELGYVIACQVPSDTQPTPVPGITGASVGFFRSDALTEGSFVDLTNSLFNQVFLTGDQCKTYLNSNGYWTSWGAVPAGMVLYLDAGITASYPGTGTTWYDLSGYGNNGTINGASYVGGTAAALNFNGTSSDYVDFASVNSIPIGNDPYTISIWFNSDEMPSSRGFIGWGNFGTNNQVNAWRLLNSAGNSGFVHYWWGNDLAYVTPMSTGTWYNGLVTFDGTTRSIWINNTLVTSDTPVGHNVPYATNLKIGVTATFLNEWFDGKIAQAIIYQRGATNAEIAAIWNSGKTRFGY